MKPLRIYFAHPMCEYGTELEKEVIERIKEADIDEIRGVDDIEIVNPSDPKILREFKAFGKKNAMHMKFFLDLVRTCDVIVGMPFLNGQWGAGVYAEMKVMQEKCGSVWQVEWYWDDDGSPYFCLERVNVEDIRPLSITETRQTVKMVKHYKGGE